METIKLVRRNRRHAARHERELVFEKNPQLNEYDRLHGQYEREFVRTYAKRKHADGFRQRPTFTLPSLPTRPEWPRFQREQNWKSLDLEGNAIELRLLDEAGKNKWFCFRFVPDPRLSEIKRLPEAAKIGRTNYEYGWRTPSGHPTQIEPQGAKLIFRSDATFLSMTFNIRPPQSRLPYDQAAATKYSAKWSLSKFWEHNPDVGVTTCAVDLGIRHLGATSIACEGVVTKRRILHNRISLPDSPAVVNVPSLAEIARVQRQLRRARRKTGKMSLAKTSCRHLQEHYRNMQADRFKKAAAALCAYASHFGADFLIFEDLQRLVPDTVNERGVNRALANWNRGAIVDFAEKIAEDYCLRVVKVPAYHTSRICASCNGVGQRFDQGVRRPFRKPRRDFSVTDEERRSVRLSFLGHWFYCPKCHRRIHADINASENLHRVFLGTFPKAKRDGDFLLVDGERIELATIKAEAENQLALASYGPTPF